MSRSPHRSEQRYPHMLLSPSNVRNPPYTSASTGAASPGSILRGSTPRRTEGRCTQQNPATTTAPRTASPLITGASSPQDIRERVDEVLRRHHEVLREVRSSSNTAAANLANSNSPPGGRGASPSVVTTQKSISPPRYFDATAESGRRGGDDFLSSSRYTTTSRGSLGESRVATTASPEIVRYKVSPYGGEYHAVVHEAISSSPPGAATVSTGRGLSRIQEWSSAKDEAGSHERNRQKEADDEIASLRKQLQEKDDQVKQFEVKLKNFESAIPELIQENSRLEHELKKTKDTGIGGSPPSRPPSEPKPEESTSTAKSTRKQAAAALLSLAPTMDPRRRSYIQWLAVAKDKAMSTAVKKIATGSAAKQQAQLRRIEELEFELEKVRTQKEQNSEAHVSPSLLREENSETRRDVMTPETQNSDQPKIVIEFDVNETNFVEICSKWLGEDQYDSVRSGWSKVNDHSVELRVAPTMTELPENFLSGWPVTCVDFSGLQTLDVIRIAPRCLLGCKSLSTIKGLKIGLSKVSEIGNSFLCDCDKLADLDLSGFEQIKLVVPPCLKGCLIIECGAKNVKYPSQVPKEALFRAAIDSHPSTETSNGNIAKQEENPATSEPTSPTSPKKARGLDRLKELGYSSKDIEKMRGGKQKEKGSGDDEPVSPRWPSAKNEAQRRDGTLSRQQEREVAHNRSVVEEERGTNGTKENQSQGESGSGKYEFTSGISPGTFAEESNEGVQVLSDQL